MKKYIKPSIDVKEIYVESLLASASPTISKEPKSDPVDSPTQVLSRENSNFSVWDD